MDAGSSGMPSAALGTLLLSEQQAEKEWLAGSADRAILRCAENAHALISQDRIDSPGAERVGSTTSRR